MLSIRNTVITAFTAMLGFASSAATSSVGLDHVKAPLFGGKGSSTQRREAKAPARKAAALPVLKGSRQSAIVVSAATHQAPQGLPVSSISKASTHASSGAAYTPRFAQDFPDLRGIQLPSGNSFGNHGFAQAAQGFSGSHGAKPASKPTFGEHDHDGNPADPFDPRDVDFGKKDDQDDTGFGDKEPSDKDYGDDARPSIPDDLSHPGEDAFHRPDCPTDNPGHDHPAHGDHGNNNPGGPGDCPAAPVPEPGTFALLGAGLVGVWGARMLRRNLTNG